MYERINNEIGENVFIINSLIINFDMNKAWKITGAIIGIILVVVLLRGCV